MMIKQFRRSSFLLENERYWRAHSFALLSLFAPSHPTRANIITTPTPRIANDNDSSRMSLEEMNKLQTQLHTEASYLTRTLYRKCLQSIKLLAKGNTRDEIDFAEREASEKMDFTNTSIERRVSMAPPVNRSNELSSRAEYYKTHTRENFDGHFSLLGEHGFHIGDEGNMTHGLGGSTGAQRGWNQYQGGHHHLGGQISAQYHGAGATSATTTTTTTTTTGHYMWREEQITQFIYLMRSGEEKRRWIMADYEFDDTKNNVLTMIPPNEDNGGGNNSSKGAIITGWSLELEHRLVAFEKQANLLVIEMYRREGWLHSSDYEMSSEGVQGGGSSNEEDDNFFSDIDDSDDDEDNTDKKR